MRHSTLSDYQQEQIDEYADVLLGLLGNRANYVRHIVLIDLLHELYHAAYESGRENERVHWLMKGYDLK